jgi:hypothetical protein
MKRPWLTGLIIGVGVTLIFGVVLIWVLRLAGVDV